MREFLTFVSISIFLAAFAGPRDVRAEGGQTHGGGAIVCRSPNGAITRAEVLDVFEARELYGLNPVAVTDVDATRTAMLGSLRSRYLGKSLYPAYLEQTLAMLHPRFKLLNPGVRLEVIPDAFPKINIRGCEIEQLASFNDDGVILLDREIMGALDPLNRLAIELHESAYLLDRKWRKATNSVFARKLVGFLLADHADPKLDPMIAAYDFDVPHAGIYGVQGSMSCRAEIQLRDDGGLRVYHSPGDCPDRISPTPFEANGYGDFLPTGMPDEWHWTNRKPGQTEGYSLVVLKRLGSGAIDLGGETLTFRTQSTRSVRRPLRTRPAQIHSRPRRR
ncbi:MAG: hypothetical protein JST04_11770 [Bdellovibrionales bacterium]|nr:hypothetical protein [Bdellovibrionales bacterium]